VNCRKRGFSETQLPSRGLLGNATRKREGRGPPEDPGPLSIYVKGLCGGPLQLGVFSSLLLLFLYLQLRFLFFLLRFLYLYLLLRFLYLLLRFLHILLRSLYIGFSATRHCTEYRGKSGEEEDDDFSTRGPSFFRPAVCITYVYPGGSEKNLVAK
jgi:hypothetical protein